MNKQLKHMQHDRSWKYMFYSLSQHSPSSSDLATSAPCVSSFTGAGCQVLTPLHGIELPAPRKADPLLLLCFHTSCASAHWPTWLSPKGTCPPLLGTPPSLPSLLPTLQANGNTHCLFSKMLCSGKKNSNR